MSNSQNDVIYDVIQVGYGPVSEVMAMTLARQGHRVAVFEMWTDRFPLPRAVCIDHEMYRMLSAIGLRDQLRTVSHPAPPYRWFNAEWKELLHIDWSAESISGGTEVNFVHQPTIEAMFDTAVRQYQEVELNLGWEVVEIDEMADYVRVTARNMTTAETRTRLGKYLIGADGANSVVRKTIGSTQEDRGFEADWLVIDIVPNEGVTLDIPPAAQYCNPDRPTTIVPAGICDGRYYRRWEFMRMPNESREELENDEMAWRLLEPWVKPDQATMVRHKLYTFRSLIASTWRKGRMLIAGDAAHVMPPFMGQGMCAGLRDAWNLAWKLNLVLTNQANDSLLDTYQIERRPHASDVINLSMYLGKVICIPDAAVAAKRDQAFFDGIASPPPAFPHMVDGILFRSPSEHVLPPAGLISPHGTVQYQGQVGRFDDVVGLGFVLILRSSEIANSLDEPSREFLGKLGARIVYLGTEDDTNALVDKDNKFSPFMDEHRLAGMLVRPDFYLYGGVSEASELPKLIDSVAIDLGHYGFAPANNSKPAALAC